MSGLGFTGSGGGDVGEIDDVPGLTAALAAKADSSGVPEAARDAIGTALAAGAAVTITPSDGADTITIAVDMSAIDEEARDALGAALTAGTGMSVTANDGANTITVAIDVAAEAERARDTLGAAFTAGAGISVSVNDGADTITIAIDTAAETERVQDIIGALFGDATGFDVTYDDTANTFVVTLNGLNVVSATGVAANTVGYLGAPQNVGLDSGNVTLALSDSGKHLYHSDGSARDLTIPANASVAFPVGAIISGVNENGAGVITLKITTDTLRWTDQTGQRALAANATFSIMKVAATVWRLMGTGIS